MTKGYVKTLDGRNYHDYNNNPNEYRFVLSDGAQFAIYLPYPECNGNLGCGNIKVDIDGYRGPYTSGKDFFCI